MKLHILSDLHLEIADFRLIKKKEGRYSRPFTPRDSINLHESAVAWLKAKLGEPFDGPTVVVTHHLPSDRSVAERYKQGALTGCFASHLDHLLGRSELWIHGHTHDSSFYEANGTLVVCNPRGYSRPGRPIENLCFADLIVEVEKGRACLASPAPLTLAEVNAALESVERGGYLLSGGGTLSYASLDDLPIPLKNKLLVATWGSACPKIPGVKDAIYWTDWVRLSGLHTKGKEASL